MRIRRTSRTYTSRALIAALALVVAACGADGPDATDATDATDAIAAEGVGIEVLAGGDDQHDTHLDGDHGDGNDAADASPGDTDTAGHGDDGGMEAHGSGMAVPGTDGVDEMVEEPEDDGQHGDDDAATVTDEGTVIEIEMVEFGFVADLGELPLGEAITFRFTNTGVVPHEAMFGTEHQQEEFADSADHGDHGEAGHHGDVAAITLDPGAVGDITVKFLEAGEVWIGCHLPGHYDAGMVATFVVA
ncbi:MAG TPA: hypothetical protein VIS05_03880 [Ilumatobacter sp.]